MSALEVKDPIIKFVVNPFGPAYADVIQNLNHFLHMAWPQVLDRMLCFFAFQGKMENIFIFTTMVLVQIPKRQFRTSLN